MKQFFININITNIKIIYITYLHYKLQGFMNLLQFELLLLKKFEKINFSIKKKISLLKIIIIRLRYLIMIDIFIEHVI